MNAGQLGMHFQQIEQMAKEIAEVANRAQYQPRNAFHLSVMIRAKLGGMDALVDEVAMATEEEGPASLSKER